MGCPYTLLLKFWISYALKGSRNTPNSEMDEIQMAIAEDFLDELVDLEVLVESSSSSTTVVVVVNCLQVAASDGVGRHVHPAQFTFWERCGGLFQDAKGVVGVSVAEMSSEIVPGWCSPRASFHWAEPLEKGFRETDSVAVRG